MIKAIKLVLKEGTTLDLYFNDSTVRRYDVLSLMSEYPQFEALKDRKLFLKGKLFGWSGIVWNDELDLPMEAVYDEGTDVSEEYNDIDLVVFGSIVKEKRLEQYLSQEELAKKIGIDQSDLSKIEKGIFNPSIKMISRIAKGLNCKINYLSLFK